MAVMVSPQVVRLPDNTEAYGQLGQGSGALLAALLDLYRRRGPQVYQAPTGATARISPAERVAGAPNVRLADLIPQAALQAGGTVTPTRLPFLGPQGISDQDIRRAQFADMTAVPPHLKRQVAEAELEGTQARTKQTTANAALLEQLKTSGMLPIYDQQGNVIGARQSEVTEEPATSQTTTDAMLTPTKTVPGQVLGESLVRSATQNLREREVQRGLTKSFKSRTAVAARALGDAANIAVEERKILEESFPQDTDSYKSRLAKEQSVLSFFDEKEREFQKTIAQPIPQVLKGIAGGRPRYEMDPTQVSAHRKAQEGLVALRQARGMYKQMFTEANEKMPPIGAVPKGSGGVTPSGLKYTIEE